MSILKKAKVQSVSVSGAATNFTNEVRNKDCDFICGQIRYKAIVLLFLLMYVGNAVAGRDVFTTRTKGSLITVGQTFTAKDDQYDYMQLNSGTWPNVFTNVTVDDYVRLHYTGGKTKHYSSSWFAEVRLNVDGWNAAGVAQTTQVCTLRVDYNPVAGTTYTDISTFTWKNVHRLKFTVNSISSSFGSNILPDDIQLETDIVVDRRFYMNPAFTFTTGYTTTALCTTPATGGSYIDFYWDYLQGAEEYDFEWVFKSYHDANATIDFSKSARVTTTQQFYRVNNAFDRGYIYYRVRGVSKDFATGTKRLEGNWTQGSTFVTVCNIEPRNWTYNAVYAEEGKKKEVMNYADGSGRGRQVISLSNTDNIAVVSEDIYDYEGRPAIKTLPAPSKGLRNDLKFYSNFNLNLAASPYSRVDFDNDAQFANCTVSTAPGMLGDPTGIPAAYTMGASYYYSDYNAQKLVNGAMGVIPHADRYPFTQTVYNTNGEVKMQGGVGTTLKIGGGRETQFLNSTASQAKLDRLFGNEVGYAEHYREKVTVDPNGQISVAYEDLSGKVIATALRGGNPGNLSALSENYTAAETVYEDFSQKNQLLNDAYVVDEDINVSVANTTYSFTYQVSPQQFQMLCNSQNFSCKYILRIDVIDECGTLISSVPSGAVNVDIPLDAASYTSSPYTSNFTVTFPRSGIYKVRKTLSLDPAGMATALAAYENALRTTSNGCVTSLATLQANYAAQVDNSECLSCEQNCSDEAKTVTNWATFNAYGITFADSNAFVSWCKNKCKPLPEKKTCAEFLETLKNDVSPGGQYFAATVPAGSYVAGTTTVTVGSTTPYFDVVASLNGSSTFLANFNTANTTNGCNATGTISGSVTTWLTNNWDDCYANYLVKYHPEYCRYQRCEDLKTSVDFSAELLSMDYNRATSPSTTSDPHPVLTLTLTPVGTSIVNGDPFFNGISNIAADKTNMQAQVANCTQCATQFPGITPATQAMWDWAAVAPTTAASNDERWKNFVQLYLSEKSDYENVYKLSGASQICPALTDNSSPPDNLTDQAAAAVVMNNNTYYTLNINQAFINDPDLIKPLSTIGASTVIPTPYNNLNADSCIMTSAKFTLGDIGSDGITSTSTFTTTCASTVSLCAALPTFTSSSGNCSYVFYARIPQVYQNFPTDLTQIANPNNCWVQISDVFTMPSTFSGLTTTQRNYYAGLMETAMNTYTSSPYDFVMSLVYTSGVYSAYKIEAPASLGLLGNGVELRLERYCNGTSSSYCPQQMSGAQKYCGQAAAQAYNPHCVCTQVNQIKTIYNTKDAGNNSFYGIDYSTYPTWESYAAAQINSAYSLGTGTITATHISTWAANCTTNVNASPYVIDANGDITGASGNTTYAVPAALDCNPQEPCQAQGYSEAAYAAQEAWEEQIEAALQNFILTYKSKCLHKVNLAESFKVNYSEIEYHYTLYYYDQAGNLVRTVPPSSVKRLTPAQLYVSGVNQVNVQRLADAASPGSVSFIYPGHSRLMQSGSLGAANLMVTNYKYNTLNKPVEQETPDGGLSTFFYDLLGRIVVSQNDNQRVTTATSGSQVLPYKNFSNKSYSYTLYDGQGRISEAGELQNATVMTHTIAMNLGSPTLATWLTAGTNKRQQTKTQYDTPLSGSGLAAQFNNGQQYLRKRVASVSLDEDANGTYEHATHYSYDVHGNVNELVNEDVSLSAINMQYKKTEYVYDLVSGNVNQVSYQAKKRDAFYHRYYYDADNRITTVYTSSDTMIRPVHWDEDARYSYYLHGPLNRTEIGDDKVQGLDYAYTLMGWIKSVNSNTLGSGNDVGTDSYQAAAYKQGELHLHRNHAQDVMGYSLEYFNGDYLSINSAAQTKITGSLSSSTGMYGAGTNKLYNGNIAAMATALYKPNLSALPTQMPTMLRSFAYDQLNRLTTATAQTVTAGSSLSGIAMPGTPATSDYYEAFTYDADGNILTAKRRGYTASGITNQMDDMTYNYNTIKKNQLNHVVDNGDNTNTSLYQDIKLGQLSSNYDYDQVGNLISDSAEKISNIEWLPNGKIYKITRYSNSIKSDLEFHYDAMGQRILKIAKGRTGSGYVASNNFVYTYYSRDAQGNVLAIYTKKPNGGTPTYYLSEQHIYGSARIGMKAKEKDMEVAMVPNAVCVVEKGVKKYELSNHLGNVLISLTDRKLTVDNVTYNNLGVQTSSSPDGVVDYYLPDVASTSDYYSFGMAMPNRTFSSSSYRQGFNGKERDIETGTDDYDFGARIYDGRLGRWKSRDPLFKSYPSFSPYNYGIGNPIKFKDIDGNVLTDIYGNIIYEVDKDSKPVVRALGADVIERIERVFVFSNDGEKIAVAKYTYLSKATGKEIDNKLVNDKSYNCHGNTCLNDKFRVGSSKEESNKLLKDKAGIAQGDDLSSQIATDMSKIKGGDICVIFDANGVAIHTFTYLGNNKVESKNGEMGINEFPKPGGNPFTQDVGDVKKDATPQDIFNLYSSDPKNGLNGVKMGYFTPVENTKVSPEQIINPPLGVNYEKASNGAREKVWKDSAPAVSTKVRKK